MQVFYGPPHAVVIGWSHGRTGAPPSPPPSSGSIKRSFHNWKVYGRTGNFFVWNNAGSEGGTPPTSGTVKRLYHNWRVHGRTNNFYVWNSAGDATSGGGSVFDTTQIPRRRMRR